METKNLRRSILILSVVLGVYNLIVLNIAYFLEQNLINIPYTLVAFFYFILVYAILGKLKFLEPLQKWVHYFFMAFIITDFVIFLIVPDVELPVLDWSARAISITLLAMLWLHLQKTFEEE